MTVKSSHCLGIQPRVFVSSTIQGLARDRTVATEAIRGLKVRRGTGALVRSDLARPVP